MSLYTGLMRTSINPNTWREHVLLKINKVTEASSFSAREAACSSVKGPTLWYTGVYGRRNKHALQLTWIHSDRCANSYYRNSILQQTPILGLFQLVLKVSVQRKTWADLWCLCPLQAYPKLNKGPFCEPMDWKEGGKVKLAVKFIPQKSIALQVFFP